MSLPAGSLARVMPFATILESQKTGLPASSAARAAAVKSGEKTRSPAISTMPQA
jgi:hypothetical protein